MEEYGPSREKNPILVPMVALPIDKNYKVISLVINYFQPASCVYHDIITWWLKNISPTNSSSQEIVRFQCKINHPLNSMIIMHVKLMP